MTQILHRLAVWLGLAEDINLDVPEWLTEAQQSADRERGIAELDSTSSVKSRRSEHDG